MLSIMLIGVFALGVGGCGSSPVETAIEEDAYPSALAALEKITSEAELARVAREARQTHIRTAAVHRISDPAELGRLALESDSSVVREAAVRKVTDASVLSQVAVHGGSKGERLAALERLTGAEDLVAVVLGLGLGTMRSADADSDDDVLRAALSRLMQPTTLADLDTGAEAEPNVRGLALYLRAMADVPDAHRARLLNTTLPAVFLLMDPEVAGVAGEVAAVKAGWDRISASNLYSGAPVYGEWFGLRIETTKLDEPVAGEWQSVFPTHVEIALGEAGFVPAKISLVELLDPLSVRLSAAQRAEIATEYRDPNVRAAAAQTLTDQGLLSRIAVADFDASVRVAVVTRLTDVDLLARIVAQDSASRVRRAAEARLKELGVEK